MKRIVILVNKDFEYAGFIEGLRDTVQVYAGTNGRDAECRFDNLIADIYCIQNLFGKYKYGKCDSPDNINKNSSNSEMKYGYLTDLFKSNSFRLEDCDGILSFSTSESTPRSQGGFDYDDNSKNGCVYVGNRFFLSDRHDDDRRTKSHLSIGNKESNYTEYYWESPISKKMYDFLKLTDMELKIPYNNPSYEVRCKASEYFTCVGVVNVMDYSCYKNADKFAYEQSKCQSRFMDDYVGIETTHGVVVKALRDINDKIEPKIKTVPVNFISPIVDRYLKFDEDVDGKYGKQNYICSYNGGVVTGHMLKILNENM